MKFKFICFLAVHFFALSSVVAQNTPIPTPGSSYTITPFFADGSLLPFEDSVINNGPAVIGVDANGAEIVSSNSSIDLGGGRIQFEFSLETNAEPMGVPNLIGMSTGNGGIPVELIPHTVLHATISAFDEIGELIVDGDVSGFSNVTPSWNGSFVIGLAGEQVPFITKLTLSFTVIVDSFLLGDINRDGAVDLLDVQPFIDLIPTSAPFQGEGDINGDGIIDLLDVGGFVDLIIQG